MKRRHPSAFSGQYSACRTIARFAVIEALHSRLILVWSALLLVVFILLQFTHSLAIIEADDAALSISAPLARLMAICVTSVFSISSNVRELNERGIELILSAHVARPSWLIGRFIGHSGAALGTTAAAASPLIFAADPGAVMIWASSLYAELTIVVGLGLLVSITMRRLPAALLSCAAIYVCARIVGVVLQLQQTAADGVSSWLADSMIALLAVILPRLDLFANTDWLIESTSPLLTAAVIGPGLIQSLIYAAVILLAGSLDFERRDV